MKEKEQPEYAAIDVPDDKDPSEYDYRERRADILRRMQEGPYAPWELNQTQMADEYGVSRQTIHKDVHERIKPYMEERLGDAAELETNELFRSIIGNIRTDAERLREEGEYDAAARADKRAADVTEKWFDWLFDYGVKERAPDKHEIDADVSTDETEVKAYAGFDLTEMPGVDPDRMVGMAVDDDTDGDEDDAEG